MAEEDAGVSDLDALSRQMSYALVKVPPPSHSSPCSRLPPPPPGLNSAHSKVGVPRWQNCDMNEEMRTDCVENAITAIERYPNNYEVAALLPWQ